MKKVLILCSLLGAVALPVKNHAFTGLYLGWADFVNAAQPLNSKANSLGVGILGTTPTRVYFVYNVLGRFIFTSGAVNGMLGWGIDLALGVGYRFLNPAYKRSGFDVGLDAYFFFAPHFLNSQTTFTETALYYGVGLGVNVIYKINPYIGIGIRGGLRYTIDVIQLSSRIPGSGGVGFHVGMLLTF